MGVTLTASHNGLSRPSCRHSPATHLASESVLNLMGRFSTHVSFMTLKPESHGHTAKFDYLLRIDYLLPFEMVVFSLYYYMLEVYGLLLQWDYN